MGEDERTALRQGRENRVPAEKRRLEGGGQSWVEENGIVLRDEPSEGTRGLGQVGDERINPHRGVRKRRARKKGKAVHGVGHRRSRPLSRRLPCIRFVLLGCLSDEQRSRAT